MAVVTTLDCNERLFKLIHKIQVHVYKETGLELKMEEALELYLINENEKGHLDFKNYESENWKGDSSSNQDFRKWKLCTDNEKRERRISRSTTS